MPFTPDQLRAGYARNAAQLRALADRAHRTGRPVNGFEYAYLDDRATEYDRLSRASDDAIRAHLARPVPPYAQRRALREATLQAGRGKK